MCLRELHCIPHLPRELARQLLALELTDRGAHTRQSKWAMTIVAAATVVVAAAAATRWLPIFTANYFVQDRYFILRRDLVSIFCSKISRNDCAKEVE